MKVLRVEAKTKFRPNWQQSHLIGGWFTNPFEKYAQVTLDHIPTICGVKIPKNL